jgi:hypothetical protein
MDGVRKEMPMAGKPLMAASYGKVCARRPMRS